MENYRCIILLTTHSWYKQNIQIKLKGFIINSKFVAVNFSIWPAGNCTEILALNFVTASFYPPFFFISLLKT